MSAQQISSYLAAEQTATARLASARAQLVNQQIRLEQTQLLAPDDGLISVRTATVGAVVPAGQEMATRQDVERSIAALRAEMQAEIAKLRAEMVDRFAKLEARLAALEERSKHLSTRTFVLASHVPTYALIIGLYFR